jgi:hypothetical protein
MFIGGGRLLLTIFRHDSGIFDFDSILLSLAILTSETLISFPLKVVYPSPLFAEPGAVNP